MKLEVLFACLGGLGNEWVDDVGLKTESLKPGSSFFNLKSFIIPQCSSHLLPVNGAWNAQLNSPSFQSIHTCLHKLTLFTEQTAKILTLAYNSIIFVVFSFGYKIILTNQNTTEVCNKQY